MVRRLLLGVVLGFIVGGLVAAGLVAGLKMPEFVGPGGALLAYVSAAITGALTGLVAGKPIWATGAKIEAGLKAVFGALLGAGLMFAMRQWAGSWQPDLGFVGAGHAAVGSLPAASLPLLAAVLGGFFELDNTGGDEGDATRRDATKDRKRVAPQSANGKAKPRVLEAESDGGEEAEVVSGRAKR
jgi:hypothetical protein